MARVWDRGDFKGRQPCDEKIQNIVDSSHLQSSMGLKIHSRVKKRKMRAAKSPPDRSQAGKFPVGSSRERRPNLLIGLVGYAFIHGQKSFYGRSIPWHSCTKLTPVMRRCRSGPACCSVYENRN